MSQLQHAFQKFDAYNQQDPNLFSWEGTSYPQEYFLALKLHGWVLQLDTAANEPLMLASRSQHIGRWEIPRESYPDGRDAYLQWRRDLAAYHAERVTSILQDTGYADDVISRVRQIVLKQKIKADADVQTIENALCLVFLQFQYEAFHPLHSAEKVVNILKRSLLKMDSRGHQFALQLSYSAKGLEHIKFALALIDQL